MTAIAGYVAPSCRSGELGVHSVDGFNVTVPNLKVAQNFSAAFVLLAAMFAFPQLALWLPTLLDGSG